MEIQIPKKASENDYWGRFREIISDPLNLLIEKDINAGITDNNGYVNLHNGNKVPITGENSYYGDFSKILVINRGVHEPLEEFCFQETLKKIKYQKPVMIELGSYWAHYSMWFLKKFPEAECFMIDSDSKALNTGVNNFSVNNFTNGKFYHSKVGNDGFELDLFANTKNLKKISILHSDIQGSELQMLDGASQFLSQQVAEYIFLSTHSQEIHEEVKKKLKSCDYIIEISSDFNNHTTSGDGFILATASSAETIFDSLLPLGRCEIISSNPYEIIKYLNNSI